MKFRSDVAGRITGVRFYKASANVGRHVEMCGPAQARCWRQLPLNSKTDLRMAAGEFRNASADKCKHTLYVASIFTVIPVTTAPISTLPATSGENNPRRSEAPSSNRNGVYAYGDNSVFPANRGIPVTTG